MRVCRCLAVLFGLLPLAGYAQETVEPAEEVTTREEPVIFRTRVNLVSVPVVVRDRNGNAVGDLQRRDFELRDDGEPRTISRFSVERWGSGESPLGAVPEGQESESDLGLPQRYVAYLFDDLHLKREHLVRAREALLQLLEASDLSAEPVAIYTTSGRIATDFTTDVDLLRQSALTIMPRGGVSRSESPCTPLTEYQADRIVNYRDRQAEAFASADYMACGVRMDGRELELLARRLLLVADFDAASSMGTVHNVISKLYTMPGLRSLVLVSPGFLIQGGRDLQQSQIIDHAVRAGVMVHALDPRGAYALVPGGNASVAAAGTGNVNRRATFERMSAIEEGQVMANLANGTGGAFFHGSNDLDTGFRSFAAPEYLYVLGFVPDEEKLDGRRHPIRVRLRNPAGLTVEARRDYFAPDYVTDPEGEARQEIEEAFFSGREMEDLSVGFETQFFKTGEYDATVVVIARLDMRQIVFRQEEDRNRNDVVVVTGLFDENGNYLSGTQKTLELRLMDETLDSLLSSGLGVRTEFDVRPGRYMVRLVVRDTEGQQLTTVSDVVEVPW